MKRSKIDVGRLERTSPTHLTSTVKNLIRSVKSLAARINPAPVIVLGNQKSGTTAIAALLAEAAGLSVTLDLFREFKNPVIDQVKLGKMTMAQFVKRNKLDFSRDIIKEPSLSAYYPELVALFPDARFVIVIRDPRDNIRSILNRLGIQGTADEVTEADRLRLSRAWELIIDGRWLGLDGANYIEMLAQRWNYIVDSYLDNADQMNLLQYEVFLRDKVAEIERLAGRLGLEVRNDITGRVDHPFQPAGDRSVSWMEFFGPVNLARIETTCRERMRRFGYEPSM